jgi:hypothetical protein
MAHVPFFENYTSIVGEQAHGVMGQALEKLPPTKGGED